jgi:hypothetical protein
MKNRLRNILAFSILPQIGFVIWLRSRPEIVETYYSLGIYPHIASFFRILYGWIPFSVGDCLYSLLLIISLVYLFRNRIRIRTHPLVFTRNAMIVVSVAYFCFHLLWGFNYYRQPLTKVLRLDEAYKTEDLLILTRQLVSKTNALQTQITGNTYNAVIVPYSKEEIMAKTVQGYEDLRTLYPIFSYTHPSIKNSLLSTLLSYMGYGGYLNPFTNEAQVNRKIPLFRFPVVCGHEIGHQLGYSAENETNFIGYLVTLDNPDTYFQYSALSFAAGYCLSELKKRNPAVYKEVYSQFTPGVLANLEELRIFWARYENPLEPVFKFAFNSFLKANNQAEGIKSYNRIVSLLVNYHKKHAL